MAKPFVKWAGGKRQLLPIINEMVPKRFNTYYEPFVGGGAVYFDIAHSPSCINDINRALINTYEQIKINPTAVYEHIIDLDDMPLNAKEYYYIQRAEFNRKMLCNEYDVRMAALFIFLNKHCFNGVYRVNNKGQFNVPYNGKTNVSCTFEELQDVSGQLQNTQIMCGDFEVVCNMAQQGDFVFIDSPYAPINKSTFDSYAGGAFRLQTIEEWQKRLKY